jgi:hypothetical protein
MPDSGTIGNQRLSLAVPNQSNIESEGRMFNLQYVFETKCLNPFSSRNAQRWNA